MSLKKETIKIGEREIVIKQLSFAEHLQLLDSEDKPSIYNRYKVCVVNSEVMDEITIQEGTKLLEAVNKLNGWKKEEDFPKGTSESGK